MTAFDYDAELAGYHRRLMGAADIGAGDRVLDVGCGTGLTTRDAARAAGPSGAALGVDISAQMLSTARRQAAAEGLGNVEFLHADAGAHTFAAEQFTVGISRFGTMFFDDPVAAFANIGRSLRPGARFVQLVWQARERQEWDAAIRAALTGEARSSEPSGSAADAAFALADPDVAARVMTAAGFATDDIVDVCEPVYYGSDPEQARAGVLQLRLAQELLEGQDDAATRRALDRLGRTLEARHTGDGVRFDSRAWLITARRRR